MKETSIEQLREKAAKIKWFFCDIDGTLTDGGVYYSSKGELLKRFSLRDGTGFFLLKQCGIKTGFITTENSPIVEQRANKLKIDKYICGIQHKVEAISDFITSEGIVMDEIAYVGDELNDVNLLKVCGLSFAVGDACALAKDVADIICETYGGKGAFREAVDTLLRLKGINISSIVEEVL